MHTIISRRLVAVGVTALAIGVTGAPAAHASKKSEKKQNAAIKAVAKAGKKINANAKAAKTAADAANSAASVASTAAGAADKKGSDAGTAVAALSTKVDGIVTTATAALTQLADGLTAAGAGLTKLGSAVAAQEYGVIKLQLGGTDIAGAILTSADIPDDSNGTTVSGTLIGSIPAMTAATPITVRAGIRSAEADGTGAANPAGSAGLVSMRLDSPSAALEGGGTTASPPATGFYLPLTSAPNCAKYPADPATCATTGNAAPVYDIPLTAGRPSTTDSPFGIPTAKTIDLTDPATLYNPGGAGVAPFTMANPTAGAIPFTVTITVRFHDLQPSATDVTQ